MYHQNKIDLQTEQRQPTLSKSSFLIFTFLFLIFIRRFPSYRTEQRSDLDRCTYNYKPFPSFFPASLPRSISRCYPLCYPLPFLFYTLLIHYSSNFSFPNCCPSPHFGIPYFSLRPTSYPSQSPIPLSGLPLRLPISSNSSSRHLPCLILLIPLQFNRTVRPSLLLCTPPTSPFLLSPHLLHIFLNHPLYTSTPRSLPLLVHSHLPNMVDQLSTQGIV